MPVYKTAAGADGGNSAWRQQADYLAGQRCGFMSRDGQMNGSQDLYGPSARNKNTFLSTFLYSARAVSNGSPLSLLVSSALNRIPQPSVFPAAHLSAHPVPTLSNKHSDGKRPIRMCGWS